MDEPVRADGAGTARRPSGAAPGPPPGGAAAPLAVDDEAELVAALRAGDELAFVRLVGTEGARLLAVARRLLRDEEEARDAVQDVFLSVVRKLSDFRGDARLSTWLHRLVVNAAGARLRRREVREAAGLEPGGPDFLSDGHRVPSEEGATPAEEVEDSEVRRRVRAAIDHLPETHRSVLLLRDIEGLDTTATAEALGLATGAVRTRLHRARQALRELLVRGGVRP